MSTYTRVKVIEQNSHLATSLRIEEPTGKARYLLSTNRHRKDCPICTKKGYFPNWKDWLAAVEPKVEYVATALEEGMGNPPADLSELSPYLSRIGKMLQDVPPSPDEGATAELIAKTGDCLCDAALALDYSETPATTALIQQAAQQLAIALSHLASLRG